ncbi:Transcriptional regulator [Seminavis robusta]|uniref:Transcriptional regulator n=1 Tax=Seminavis robusta TaxID=568900 RepID=A0A9N8HC88_9STRA|nr:Transcriptional regulator [Seminavis robusta]|eukprot:Sro309_g113780.1 Transcriptional regulator (435) ;mRNA; f:31938-33420
MAMMTASAPVDMACMGRAHLNRLADQDQDPTLLTGITYPGKHDVMLGRGGESTYHCGNIAFRQLVEDHKNQYYNAPRAHKSRVVAEVVRKWRQLSPPGRFLTRSAPSEGDKSAWHDVGDRRALKKASHSLRDAVRCFSIEKKQREKELLEMDNNGQQRNKRGRDEEEEPEYMPSMAVKSRTMMGGFGGGYQRDNGREFIMSSSSQPKKPSLIILPAAEERPNKMRRVVCDEREEAEDDCRREGGEEEDCRRGGGDDDERCSGEERDSCAREDDGGRSDRVPCSIFVERQPVFNFPSAAAPAPKPLFAAPAPKPLFADAPVVVCPKQEQRLAANASPCGSAGWFTSGMADMPVKAAPSFVLPTADFLVKEVSPASPTPPQLNLGSLSDEDSMGWFSESEEDPTSFFSAAPSFHVSLRKPVASRNNRTTTSSGREL